MSRILIRSYLRDKEADALSLVSSQSTPFYFAHGQRDSFVNPNQSSALYESLLAKGVPARLTLHPNFYHGDWRLNYRKHLNETELFLDLISGAR